MITSTLKTAGAYLPGLTIRGNALVSFRTVADPLVRLVCFHYAGGNASIFRPWARTLVPNAELLAVQLPGHGWRRREQLATHVDQLTTPLCDELARYLDRPLVLFGHSMGALLAYECAWRLAAADGASVHLIASGRRAPHVPRLDRPIWSLGEREFADKLREYGGTPESVLENADLMALMAPVIRADFRLNDDYVHAPRRPMRCPVTVLGGADDPLVSLPELNAWRQVTFGKFKVRSFQGGHFFIASHADEVLEEVNATCVDVAGRIENRSPATAPL